MIEARYYEKQDEGQVKCVLCPHHCLIAPGKTGRCLVRYNDEGQLFAKDYGLLSAVHQDPVEKKPLYRFFPGKQILSIGSYGCNLRCGWCQNAAISHCGPERGRGSAYHAPAELAEMANKPGNIGIAYTYNEPAVWFEYMYDTARLVHDVGGYNVVVTNGYINTKPLQDLLTVTDAFNVDLKAFGNDFYVKQTGGSLQPVKNTMVAIAQQAVHLEIAFLVIPGLNDDMDMFRSMVRWMRDALGRKVVLHINRYFPALRTQQPPTPLDLMQSMKGIAERHVDYVYLGNVPQ